MRFVRFVIGACGALIIAAAFLSTGEAQVVAAESAGGRALTLRQGGAGSELLNRQAKLSVEGESLVAALTRLHESSGVPLLFSPSVIPADSRVSCACSAATVLHALDQMLADTQLEHEVIAGQVVIAPRRPDPAPERLASLLARNPVEIRLPNTLGELARPGVLPTRQVPQTGTITGQVVDSRTTQPLAGVQVDVVEAELGGLTQANGRFLLPNVPVGTQTLRAQRIGYRTVTQEVVVRAGVTTPVNFQLAVEALVLDEIVVTGTAGQARLREVGNAITQINTAGLVEVLETTDQLLKSRSPGMAVMTSGGTPGSGARIRLRGNVSVAMSNQPLVYVDGVRLRSDGYPDSSLPTENVVRGPNSSNTPLNDINPSDIERIEIIKGPAATTLYGTEAAVGVIQIFTKTGRPGPPVWELQVSQGVDLLWKYGPPQEPYMRLDMSDKFTRDAWRQRYELLVRGGTDNLGYFVSGGYQNNQGIYGDDWQEVANFRANLNFAPHPTLSIRLNNGYTRQDIRETGQGNNPQAALINIWHWPSTFCQCTTIEDLESLLDFKTFRPTDHFTTGATVTYSPTSQITSRMTLGYDWSQRQVRQVLPFGLITYPQGTVHSEKWNGEIATLDVVNSLTFAVTENVGSRFSMGGQLIQTSESTLGAQSIGLPGPTEPTLSTGAQHVAYETIQRVLTGGFFAQEELSFKDRYFLTGGVRVDGNSAFGKDFGFQAYPKVSVSYIISDEPWWSERIGSIKLRGAWGHAGRAPGAFDAVRTWQSESWQAQPSFVPLNSGNRNLGPERTSELELGFDGVFFDAGLNIEFTWYRRTTEDALMPVSAPPSVGFSASQLTNVGKIQNRGIEVSAQAAIVDGTRFGWDLGFSVGTSDSEVLDTGPAGEFGFGWGQTRVEEGYPAPAVRGVRIQNRNEIADPIYEIDLVGPNEPTFTGAAFTFFRLPGNLRVSARGEYIGGHWVENYGLWRANQDGVNPTCEGENGYYQRIAERRLDDVTAFWRGYCNRQIRPEYYVEPADFFKIRELSLQVPVSGLIPVATNALLTISGRNLWTWTKDEMTGGDPESCCTKGVNDRGRSLREYIPVPISWTASLRVIF